MFCGIADGRPLVAWTNDSELLLARTQSENPDGPGMDQLYTWWSSLLIGSACDPALCPAR